MKKYGTFTLNTLSCDKQLHVQCMYMYNVHLYMYCCAVCVSFIVLYAIAHVYSTCTCMCVHIYYVYAFLCICLFITRTCTCTCTCMLNSTVVLLLLHVFLVLLLLLHVYTVCSTCIYMYMYIHVLYICYNISVHFQVENDDGIWLRLSPSSSGKKYDSDEAWTLVVHPSGRIFLSMEDDDSYKAFEPQPNSLQASFPSAASVFGTQEPASTTASSVFGFNPTGTAPTTVGCFFYIWLF